MADRFLALHNIDLANREALDTTGAPKPGTPPFKRVRAGATLSSGDMTDDEREQLIGLGAIREATPEEAKAADDREAAEKEAKRQGGFNTQRNHLLQKQAAARSKIEEKYDTQKRDELAKLDEQQAKERADLDEKLATKGAPAATPTA